MLTALGNQVSWPFAADTTYGIAGAIVGALIGMAISRPVGLHTPIFMLVFAFLGLPLGVHIHSWIP